MTLIETRESKTHPDLLLWNYKIGYQKCESRPITRKYNNKLWDPRLLAAYTKNKKKN